MNWVGVCGRAIAAMLIAASCSSPGSWAETIVQSPPAVEASPPIFRSTACFHPVPSAGAPRPARAAAPSASKLALPALPPDSGGPAGVLETRENLEVIFSQAASRPADEPSVVYEPPRPTAAVDGVPGRAAGLAENPNASAAGAVYSAVGRATPDLDGPSRERATKTDGLLPYRVTSESVGLFIGMIVDSVKVHLKGIPPLPGGTPVEIARAAIKSNARKNSLYAGAGHFRVMWVADFAAALRGAETVLPPEYLGGLIEYMIRESARLGHVPTSFTPKRGFDSPYERGDSLPWLIYSVWEYARWTGDRGMIERNRPALQRLLADYERTKFKDGLIDPRITGDWQDSILRPSSTYNNICALKMIVLAREMGFSVRTDAGTLERNILKSRWRGDHFTDYDGTERPSVDAPIFAAYLDVFDKDVRKTALRNLAASGAAEPFPIRSSLRPYDKKLMPFITRLAPGYHSAVWLHLGFMYLDDLKKIGVDVGAQKAEMEASIMKYHNVLEAADGRGNAYETLFQSSDYALTMAAGQYLELVSPPPKP